MKRVWAEIDCNSWYANYRAIADAAAPATVVPVVKSDCYGLGARRAGEVFCRAGATRLAVATLEEAAELADLGVEIQVLGAPVPEEVPGMVSSGLIISVPDLATAKWVSTAAVEQGKTVRVHILIDSGMGRLGFMLSEAHDATRQIAKLPGIHVEGVYSHLPAAESPTRETLQQILAVASFMQGLEDDGFVIRFRHLANSLAVGGLPATLRHPFNMVRPGIDLHGAGPADAVRSYAVHPVVSWKSRLVAVRRLPAGFTIGYGRTYRLSSEQLVGTVAVGYADGYPRSLSNKGTVLVGGQRCQVLGSVCMDYSQISLQNAPDAGVGDEVVLVGAQGAEIIAIAEVAQAADTIPYEIMTGLGARVERRYKPLTRECDEYA